MRRRSFLKGLSAVPLASSLHGLVRAQGASPSPRARGPRVVVVGAGAFGGWTALSLLRQGAEVTLVDAWGPGNSRASSGGETRVIRGTYGGSRVYVEMVARAFELWKENEERWQRKLYRQTGAIWMVGEDDSLVRDSLPLLKERGFPFEELRPGEAARRYPQVDFTGVRSVHYETRAGYLLARRSCQEVLDGFLAEGGRYRQASVMPGEVTGALKELKAGDGASLAADVFVFACGPWLGALFPDVLGEVIKPTRQEVFFFGPAAGDLRYGEDQMPVWVDLTGGLVYGIPGNERRGFKIADDARGAPFDPTRGERVVSPEKLAWAREFVGRRFPGLKGAPLVESRVCQYEQTPDGNYLIDRHPRAANVWLVGGGSGHGFKMGPALGERVADTVLGRRALDPFFALARFAQPPRG